MRPRFTLDFGDTSKTWNLAVRNRNMPGKWRRDRVPVSNAAGGDTSQLKDTADGLQVRPLRFSGQPHYPDARETHWFVP